MEENNTFLFRHEKQYVISSLEVADNDIPCRLRKIGIVAVKAVPLRIPKLICWHDVGSSTSKCTFLELNSILTSRTVHRRQNSSRQDKRITAKKKLETLLGRVSTRSRSG